MIVSTLQNAGRHPRGVPSTDEAAGGQLVSAASYLLGQRAHDGGAGTGSEIAKFQIKTEDATEHVVVGSDLDGGKDHVRDFVSVETDVVGNLDIEVNKNRAGHDSSFGTVTSGILTDPGAGFKGRDGDTFLPLPAPGVRRLTPLECERLQALPDNWTAHGPDSRRYAALGDAVTSSVAEWLGRRILAA